MNAKQAYVLSKKHTDDTVIGLGFIKGAPCTVKKTEHRDGVTYVTLQWTANDGVTIQETTLTIYDGTPIYTWRSGEHYEVGDLAIYSNALYKCIIENSDTTFNESKWEGIGVADGNYGIVENAIDLPNTFTLTDRKVFFVHNESTFYYWDGQKWEKQIASIPDKDIDELFI